MLKNYKNHLTTRLQNLPHYYHLAFLINNLEILGSWPPLEGPKKAYIIRGVITLSLTLGHLLFVQTAFIVAGWGDTEKIASAVFLLINNYVHGLKVFVILRYQKRIQKLLVYFGRETKKFRCDNPESMKKLHRQYSWAAFMHYGIFQLGGIFACTMWILSSVIYSLKSENDRVLPMHAWYPYDSLATPMYEITVIYQGFAVYVACVHNISLDGFIIGFMAVIGCEFEILKVKIEEIGENEARELRSTEYERINALRAVDIEDKLCKELMLCVKHHVAIIDYATEYKNIFNLIIFLQFLENCLVICMTAFALAQLQEYNLTTILGNLVYLMAIIYQLFMYCYFGNVVSVQKNLMREIEANFHLRLSLSIMRYLGSWPPLKGHYRWVYILYGAFSFAFILGVFLLVQTIHLIIIWGDIEKMVAGAFLLMTNLSHTLKCHSILRSYTLGGILHHAAYQSLAIVAVFCWGLTPISFIIAGQDRRLPFEGWYPYNATKTPAFELTCVYQTASVVIACFQNIAMDTLVTGFMTVVSCQFEILKSNLRRIGIKKFSENLSLKNIETARSEDELKNFIEHHNTIIDFAKEVEAVFSTTIIVQFSVNCIIICLTAFHITKMRVFMPAELIGLIMYICCMTYQIFIYCWHGNEIVLQSESVVVAAFSGNWWRCGERYKRGLRLLMARANRPLTLKAGNLLTLSLQTFVAILRASYSFFTVLQSSIDKS